MNTRMKIVMVGTLITLLSCNDMPDKNLDSEIAKTTNNKVKLIGEKHNAAIGFDTLHYQFSYKYQEWLGKNNRIVIDKYFIKDIEMIKEDSYRVIVEISSYPSLILSLNCTPSIAKDIANNYDSRVIIAQLNSIRKINFEIKPSFDLEADITAEIRNGATVGEIVSIDIEDGGFLTYGELLALEPK